jgi:hypothetical protein
VLERNKFYPDFDFEEDDDDDFDSEMKNNSFFGIAAFAKMMRSTSRTKEAASKTPVHIEMDTLFEPNVVHSDSASELNEDEEDENEEDITEVFEDNDEDNDGVVVQHNKRVGAINTINRDVDCREEVLNEVSDDVAKESYEDLELKSDFESNGRSSFSTHDETEVMDVTRKTSHKLVKLFRTRDKTTDADENAASLPSSSMYSYWNGKASLEDSESASDVDHPNSFINLSESYMQSTIVTKPNLSQRSDIQKDAYSLESLSVNRSNSYAESGEMSRNETSYRGQSSHHTNNSKSFTMKSQANMMIKVRECDDDPDFERAWEISDEDDHHPPFLDDNQVELRSMLPDGSVLAVEEEDISDDVSALTLNTHEMEAWQTLKYHQLNTPKTVNDKRTSNASLAGTVSSSRSLRSKSDHSHKSLLPTARWFVNPNEIQIKPYYIPIQPRQEELDESLTPLETTLQPYLLMELRGDFNLRIFSGRDFEGASVDKSSLIATSDHADDSEYKPYFNKKLSSHQREILELLTSKDASSHTGDADLQKNKIALNDKRKKKQLFEDRKKVSFEPMNSLKNHAENDGYDCSNEFERDSKTMVNIACKG